MYSRETNVPTRLAFRIYFYSKIIELLDTVFMILRHKRRQISFLHVFHHASMVLLCDFGVQNGCRQGCSIFIRVILLPKNEYFYFQGRKKGIILSFFAKMMIFILIESGYQQNLNYALKVTNRSIFLLAIKKLRLRVHWAEFLAVISHDTFCFAKKSLRFNLIG